MAKTRKPKSAKKKPPPARKPEDDMHLWHAVAQTVEPLKGREVAIDIIGAKPTPVSSTSTFVMRPEAPVVVPRPLPELHHGQQPGLDKATAKRMRRGQVKIEGRIDLHGMTQAQAHQALEHFLDAAWSAGRREVLVITGKGTRRDGSIGVLRQMVPRWLNEFPNRAKVVAFSHAAPKDGGEGALYVRLKRRGR